MSFGGWFGGAPITLETGSDKALLDPHLDHHLRQASKAVRGNFPELSLHVIALGWRTASKVRWRQVTNNDTTASARQSTICSTRRRRRGAISHSPGDLLLADGMMHHPSATALVRAAAGRTGLTATSSASRRSNFVCRQCRAIQISSSPTSDTPRAGQDPFGASIDVKKDVAGKTCPSRRICPFQYIPG